jgi:hypothetical protein
MGEPHTCVADAIGVSREKAYVNARLITAAPELYAACEALLRWYDDDDSTVTDLSEVRGLAVIALAKARGEDR